MHRYLNNIGNTECMSSWKSIGLPDEIIKPSNATDNSLAPALSYSGNKTRVKFDEGCLKQDNITFTHGKIVNIYLVYEIDLWNYVGSSDPTLGNSLFGAVKLIKMLILTNIGYGNSEYGIGFDTKRNFVFPAIGFGKNVIIFGADMSLNY